MKIYTENSIYEFDTENHMCRRLPYRNNAPLLKDGEWTKYITVHYAVGEEMRIVMEHLEGEKDSITLRTTSTVVKVEE